MEELKATLNQVIPFRSEDEHKEYKHNWYIDNIDKCKEQGKKNREAKQEHYKEYSKQWYKDNKEEISKKAKMYRDENKEYLAKKKQEYGQREYFCELCNIALRVADKSRHEATDKHIKLLNEQQQLSAEELNILKAKNERLKERKAKYYNNNKDSIIQKDRERYSQNKEKAMCECGCEVYKHNLTLHCKSNKHQEYLKALEQTD